MASSIFGRMNTSVNPNSSSTSVNPNNSMLHQFAEFKRKMAGKDPKQMVEQMLSDGSMSREQYESLKSQAQSLMGILR
jgi:hypothetical protein